MFKTSTVMLAEHLAMATSLYLSTAK